MAKRIMMISPFDVLTGNLSGRQDIRYAGNKKAYDEPNGSASAENYKPRFIGAKRKNGVTYFSVRSKQTSVLNGKTRRAMGLVGVTAEIISKLKANGTYAKIVTLYNYIMEHPTAAIQLPEGVNTPYQYAVYKIREMLTYRLGTWQVSGVGGVSFTIVNPFDIEAADPLQISQRIWSKFADLFLVVDTTTHKAFVFFTDGVKHVVSGARDIGISFEAMIDSVASIGNSMYRTNLQGFSVTDNKVQYREQFLYLDGAEVTDSMKVLDNGAYSTVEPID